MHYVAYVSREGKHLLAEFPECPGCQTFAESADELTEAAGEALEGWLEAHLVDGQNPPRPVEHTSAPAGKGVVRVPVRPGLAAAIHIRWARQDAGLSQRALGERAGVSQQQMAKLEDPDENPSLETLARVGRALGLEVNVGFERPDRVSVPPEKPGARRRPRQARSSAARRSRSIR